MDDCLTVTEFARRQRVSRAAVYQWMAAIHLRPWRVAGLTLLSPADQAALLARPPKKMGRPKKVLDSTS